MAEKMAERIAEILKGPNFQTAEKALTDFCGTMAVSYTHLLSGGTAIIILIALYFVIKWAVKNGIKEAYSAITGKKTEEDVRNEKELKELGFELEDK